MGVSVMRRVLFFTIILVGCHNNLFASWWNPFSWGASQASEKPLSDSPPVRSQDQPSTKKAARYSREAWRGGARPMTKAPEFDDPVSDRGLENDMLELDLHSPVRPHRDAATTTKPVESVPKPASGGFNYFGTKGKQPEPSGFSGPPFLEKPQPRSTHEPVAGPAARPASVPVAVVQPADDGFIAAELGKLKQALSTASEKGRVLSERLKMLKSAVQATPRLPHHEDMIEYRGEKKRHITPAWPKKKRSKLRVVTIVGNEQRNTTERAERIAQLKEKLACLYEVVAKKYDGKALVEAIDQMPCLIHYQRFLSVYEEQEEDARDSKGAYVHHRFADEMSVGQVQKQCARMIARVEEELQELISQ